MPVDTPINESESDVEISELETEDLVKIVYQSISGDQDSFTAKVTRVSTFESGTEISLTKGAKIYGDFYPPIVRTPDGEELRLYTINRA